MLWYVVVQGVIAIAVLEKRKVDVVQIYITVFERIKNTYEDPIFESIAH